ncbi:MAG: pyruvate kinase, partial [Synergistaceae bacterium]|nr:pyruvate kinase [Synergistaceae bacterium]
MKINGTHPKVKIVCTIGPSSGKHEILKEMIHAGMNVARLNFSHGDYKSHGETLRLIRQVEHELGAPIPALLDTKGPEIRTGDIEGGTVTLENGNTFVLTTEECLGTAERVYMTYDLLPKEVSVGEFIFIDDGTLQVQVQEIKDKDVVCKVIVGGRLSNKKGLNLPGTDLSLPALSDKDKEDIRWGIENGMEYIAVSFVKRRSDIVEVRKLMEELNGSMKIIAKIETRQAVENIDEITDVIDGVMVARGDLGVEIATEEVPLVQKRIIEICRSKGKVVIVATQMLDSMMRNPRPTRAEASDVANAVFDGTDAVMLSGETAGGLYPVQAVHTMRNIVSKAEQELSKWGIPLRMKQEIKGVPDAVSSASVLVAKEIEASAIISLTKSGVSARMVSKHRPDCKILAATPSIKTWRELTLWWGVLPFRISELTTQSIATEEAINASIENGYLKEGELAVLTGGVPFGLPGTTNMLEVHTAAPVIASGFPLVRRSFWGKIFVAHSHDESTDGVDENTVLVVRNLNKDYLPLIEKAGAVIAESS